MKTAKTFKCIIEFMAFKWSERVAKNIFGCELGTNIYNKWCEIKNEYKGTYKASDIATMQLFYTMGEFNLEKLINHIISDYEMYPEEESCVDECDKMISWLKEEKYERMSCRDNDEEEGKSRAYLDDDEEEDKSRAYLEELESEVYDLNEK